MVAVFVMFSGVLLATADDVTSVIKSTESTARARTKNEP